MALIEVTGLRKSYGAREVLHGFELSVSEGEIVGVLGPNGSGKTTAVECIAGLRPRDGGSVHIAGLDPSFEPLALIGRPRIAFLDELSTGLDPAARRDIWQYLRLLRDEGVTMVLVTHFMDEAAHLCDRIVILDERRVVASGTPDDLAAGAGHQMTSFSQDPRVDLDALSRVPGVANVAVDQGRIVVRGDAESPQAVLVSLAAAEVAPRELRVTSPSLDEAYLHLTQGAPR